MQELGGFAEDIDVLDGTEQTYNAFNFCLAEEYLHAIIFEDWESLGNFSTDLVDQIVFWLNYDNEIGKDIEHLICKISNGSIETYKKRSFLEAIIACKQGNLARTWIDLNRSETSGNTNLYLTAMFYEDDFDYERDYLLSYADYGNQDIQKYKNFIFEIFNGVENQYKEASQSEKQRMLMKVRPYFYGIAVPIVYQTELSQIQEDLNRRALFKVLNKRKK